jgi:hypothetical protein
MHERGRHLGNIQARRQLVTDCCAGFAAQVPETAAEVVVTVLFPSCALTERAAKRDVKMMVEKCMLAIFCCVGADKYRKLELWERRVLGRWRRCEILLFWRMGLMYSGHCGCVTEERMQGVGYMVEVCKREIVVAWAAVLKQYPEWVQVELKVVDLMH